MSFSMEQKTDFGEFGDVLDDLFGRKLCLKLSTASWQLLHGLSLSPTMTLKFSPLVHLMVFVNSATLFIMSGEFSGSSRLFRLSLRYCNP